MTKVKSYITAVEIHNQEDGEMGCGLGKVSVLTDEWAKVTIDSVFTEESWKVFSKEVLRVIKEMELDK